MTPDRVAAELQRHVAESGPWRPEDVDVRVLPFQSIPLPVAGYSLRVIRPIGGIKPGVQSILVAAFSAGKEQGRLWVRADIRIFEEVVVSSRPLGFNETVRSQDVRIERRDISSLNARPFYRVEEVVGQQASRAISVNEMLTQKTVQRPILIRRGNSVNMIYETGSLRIEMPAVAEESGKVGELIQVKNPTSGKVLRGTVVDGRLVRVN